MLRTPLCDLLGIDVPIIQAGMGWDKEGMTTPPALVAAVSNAGGLGCIGGSSIRPEVIRERIRAVRKLTDRPFGVDITLPKMEDVKIPDPDEVRKEIEEKYPKHAKFTDELIPKLGLTPQPPDRKSWVKTPAATREQLKVILEEKVPILIIGLGDTAEVVPLAHDRDIKVMALAGAVKHALSHARKGSDVIIAQGYEAGGHTGTIGNFPLIPQIVDAVKPTARSRCRRYLRRPRGGRGAGFGRGWRVVRHGILGEPGVRNQPGLQKTNFERQLGGLRPHSLYERSLRATLSKPGHQGVVGFWTRRDADAISGKRHGRNPPRR